MASLTLDWLHLLVLLGVFQGVILAGVLVARRTNRTANRLLAAAMFAFSVHLASSVHLAGNLMERFPHFFGIAYPIPFLYGPLIYLYAVTVADRNRRMTPRDWLHFLPFITVVVFGAPIYLQGGAEKVAFFDQLQAGHRPLLIQIADPLKLVSGVVYSVLILGFLRRHREQVKESYSSTEHVKLHWLLWLGAGAATIWLLAAVLQLLDASGAVHIARSDDWISLAIAVLIYGIGYMGLRQSEIFRYETAEYPIPVQSVATRAVEAPEPTTPRYERSGLSRREVELLRERLLATMEQDRPWCDSELTLADLAERLSTTPHKLSELLNAQLGQSFYDFVNSYRVREVQRRIAAGEAKRVTILAIAFDAGFASKSTFNQVFKKHTNRTPSEFLRHASVQAPGSPLIPS